MFKDLGQFKAYLREVNSFDQLYIIQQGGRGVTREQIIKRLERVIAQDAKDVYFANTRLWNSVNISSWKDLQDACLSQEMSGGTLKVYFDSVIGLTY